MVQRFIKPIKVSPLNTITNKKEQQNALTKKVEVGHYLKKCKILKIPQLEWNLEQEVQARSSYARIRSWKAPWIPCFIVCHTTSWNIVYVTKINFHSNRQCIFRIFFFQISPLVHPTISISCEYRKISFKLILTIYSLYDQL